MVGTRTRWSGVDESEVVGVLVSKRVKEVNIGKREVVGQIQGGEGANEMFIKVGRSLTR